MANKRKHLKPGITVEIPGRKTYKFLNLVLDMNGTIATDGRVVRNIKGILKKLSKKMNIYLISADIHGTLNSQIRKYLTTVPIKIILIGRNANKNEICQKGDFVKNIGSSRTIAIGNGSNDVEMLRVAALGIAIVGKEGCAAETLGTADIVVSNPFDALTLLIKEKRLVATFRR